MVTQRYSVTPHPIETLLTWVKSGEIAIPEIQRPFVWDATKVRNLLDSLYRGYPVGYLIAWRNPTVKLKDGTPSAGKRILIDGQQRVTALMAALLGQEVLTKDYEIVRIRIAFHPVEERFEVANPAIRRDASWIEDVADVFSPHAGLVDLTDGYTANNVHADRRRVSLVLEKLKKIVNNSVGVIELAEDLDIETVTEIFIRVNSAGAELSQADFVMSKIAASEKYRGNLLRKAIDYFCHLAVAPEFLSRIEQADQAFATSEFLPRMRWLSDVNDDIYDPSYTDMLRVAFTSEFGRGRLQDLVALLSGRNFETKEYEEAIAEESFARLKKGILAFVNKTHFDRITMILRSAGSFWTGMLPQLMETSSSNSPYFLAYQAAQVKQGNRGFLSRDITVNDLLTYRSDRHHVFPKNYLKKELHLPAGRYNQIANLVIAQSEINIAIGDDPPATYFPEVAAQCNGGGKKYGGITDAQSLRENLSEHCLPASLLDGVIPAYDDFLEERRRLMALKIKAWFETL